MPSAEGDGRTSSTTTPMDRTTASPFGTGKPTEQRERPSQLRRRVRSSPPSPTASAARRTRPRKRQSSPRSSPERTRPRIRDRFRQRAARNATSGGGGGVGRPNSHPPRRGTRRTIRVHSAPIPARPVSPRRTAASPQHKELSTPHPKIPDHGRSPYRTIGRPQS